MFFPQVLKIVYFLFVVIIVNKLLHPSEWGIHHQASPQSVISWQNFQRNKGDILSHHLCHKISDVCHKTGNKNCSPSYRHLCFHGYFNRLQTTQNYQVSVSHKYILILYGSRYALSQPLNQICRIIFVIVSMKVRHNDIAGKHSLFQQIIHASVTKKS